MSPPHWRAHPVNRHLAGQLLKGRALPEFLQYLFGFLPGSAEDVTCPHSFARPALAVEGLDFLPGWLNAPVDLPIVHRLNQQFSFVALQFGLHLCILIQAARLPLQK